MNKDDLPSEEIDPNEPACFRPVRHVIEGFMRRESTGDSVPVGATYVCEEHFEEIREQCENHYKGGVRILPATRGWCQSFMPYEAAIRSTYL